MGTLGGNASSGEAINDSGQVAGISYTAEGERRVFITGPNGRGMVEAPFGNERLGRFGSINNDSSIAGMNNVGQVVGTTSDFGGDPTVFISGSSGVGVTQVSGFFTRAGAVNNAGQVTGDFPTFTLHAFITGPNGVGTRDLV